MNQQTTFLTRFEQSFKYTYILIHKYKNFYIRVLDHKILKLQTYGQSGTVPGYQ